MGDKQGHNSPGLETSRNLLSFALSKVLRLLDKWSDKVFMECFRLGPSTKIRI